MVKTLRAAQWPVDQNSFVDYTSVMPRRSEEPPDPMEKLAQEVLCLSREVLVLRETLDEIREYLQWITKNPDQFQIVIQAPVSPKETEPEQPESDEGPTAEAKVETQGSLFD